MKLSDNDFEIVMINRFKGFFSCRYDDEQREISEKEWKLLLFFKKDRTEIIEN